MIDINKNPSRKDLTIFGLLLILFFAFVGALAFYRWGNPGLARNVWIGGGLLSALYWLVPFLRKPLYLGWMYLAFPIGWTISHLLLALIYYGVLTPVGILLRLFRYDSMRRQPEPEATTYWIEHRPQQETKSYFRQF